MGNISHLSVFKAWKCLDNICKDSCISKENKCLVCFAKNLLLKFNQLQRRIDKGPFSLEFPTTNKEYDREKVKKCYEQVINLCNNCLEYHNSRCLVFYTRNALELILFGRKLPLARLSYMHFLLENNMLTQEQLEEAFLIFQELNLPIGSIAVIRNYLTPNHVIAILRHQKTNPILFGQSAIELKLLTEFQVENILAYQESNQINISDVLIDLGYINKETNTNMCEKYKALYNLEAPKKEI